MAWRRVHARGGGAHLYAGGHVLAMSVAEARRLAAADVIDDALYDTLAGAGRDAALALLDAGHYHLLMEDADE